MKKYIIALVLLLTFPGVAHAVDKKITELTAATTATTDDLFLVVDDPSGTPTSKKITFSNLKSSFQLSTVTKTANYTITTADDIVLGDTTGGIFTITLPTAVGSTKYYTIKRIGTGTNNLTIATTSSQTIDGSTTLDIIVTNTSVTVASDGSNWRIA